MLQVGGGTFAGYAWPPTRCLAQAIKTDTTGIVAGDAEVKIGDYGMPVYEARPASGSGYPIILVISEIWGVHEYIRDSTRRFAKAGYYADRPRAVQARGRGGPAAEHPGRPQDRPRPSRASRRSATSRPRWTGPRPGPNVKADRVGVTGWCWGGSTTIQVAATNPDMKAAVAWYGPPSRPYQGAAGPVTGFDVAKDIKIPLLLLFGETDKSPHARRTPRSSVELVKHMNPNVEIVVYPGAGHGFHADYRPCYNTVAAADAWKRCTDWFNKIPEGLRCTAARAAGAPSTSPC